MIRLQGENEINDTINAIITNSKNHLLSLGSRTIILQTLGVDLANNTLSANDKNHLLASWMVILHNLEHYLSYPCLFLAGDRVTNQCEGKKLKWTILPTWNDDIAHPWKLSILSLFVLGDRASDQCEGQGTHWSQPLGIDHHQSGRFGK